MRNSGGAQITRTMGGGLALFLILLIYDGALRKWLLPDAEQLLFIAKDVLLLVLICYALMNRPHQAKIAAPIEVRAAAFLYASWVCLEALNINLPSILVGIWGLKSHLLYAGIILVVPMAFSSLEVLLRWLERAYPWLVVPVCSLAFLQLASPGDSFINQQVRGGMEMVAYFGEEGLVRVAGPFSYITGMSYFVQSVTVLGVGLYLGGARSTLFLVGLGFALAALPATGSRGVIAVAIASATIMLFAAKGGNLIGSRMLVRIIVATSVLGGVSLLTQDAAWVALQERAESAQVGYDDSVRVLTAFTNAFNLFDLSGLFGFGSGSANFGSIALVREIEPFSWLPVGVEFEEESGRVVLELGIIGWLLSLALRVALFFWSGRLALRALTRNARVAGVLAVPVMAMGMYVGNGVFAPPVGAIYYWLCVVLLAMAQYEHRQIQMRHTHLRSSQMPTLSVR
jgi:hypothetical protein